MPQRFKGKGRKGQSRFNTNTEKEPAEVGSNKLKPTDIKKQRFERVQAHSVVDGKLNLRNDLFKLVQRSNTDPVLANIVIDGLFHWFRQTPQTPQSISPTFDEPVIRQGQIEWSQLLLGQWSREWATLQTKYLQRTNSIFRSQNHGTFWLSSIIQLIWTHCYNDSIHRNNALHGHNQQTKAKARTTRAQYKIRALYSLRHHCSHLARREWFYESPEAHFTRQSDPRHLESWIALNEARILRQVTHRQQHTRTDQRSIEEYFPPITQPSSFIGSFLLSVHIGEFCLPSLC
jgi:hypothetical protein